GHRSDAPPGPQQSGRAGSASLDDHDAARDPAVAPVSTSGADAEGAGRTRGLAALATDPIRKLEGSAVPRTRADAVVGTLVHAGRLHPSRLHLRGNCPQGRSEEGSRAREGSSRVDLVSAPEAHLPGAQLDCPRVDAR